MKKELTREYVLSQRGCYSREQTEALSFMKKDKFTIIHIVKSEIPLKDKFWFVIRKCELTTRQKQDIAIGYAEIVLPIYEAKYPDNKAPREAIQAAKDFLNGLITIEALRQKLNDYAAAAYAAYAAAAIAYSAAAYSADAAAYAAAAYSADAAAYAAYAYADAAAAAADAIAAADAAIAAAADVAIAAAADAAKRSTSKVDYSKLLLKFLIDFINNN